MNVIEHIQAALVAHTKKLFPAYAFDIVPDLVLTTDPHKQQFGDLTTNYALLISKMLQRNPRDIAEQVIADFKQEYVMRSEQAGPGFINLFLTPAAFQELLRELMHEGEQFFALESTEQVLNYSLEFVSANPTGPLHIGHGRGGIIGDVLGNILRFLGHTVTKEFYTNDAGLQIQRLGNSLKVRCQQQVGYDVVMPEDGYQGEYLQELAQRLVHQYGAQVLEKPESFFEHYAKEYLLNEIKETLVEYGIIFDVWFSEKSLHERGAITQALEILIDKGYAYEREGALWFRSTDFGDDKDRVLRKSSGELTYIAADIAYLQNKLERGANRLVMVLGQDHHSYVVRLKAVMQALGYNPDHLDIILYQLVTIKEMGTTVRMSKRAGRIVTLKDVVETVGSDIARFFYLNKKADAHLDFDIDLALKHTEENPVYYIQYAYVRTKSILEKAADSIELRNLTINDSSGIGLDEALLLKKIISLKALLKNISHNYQTHLLTYYVLELAQAFHRYYGVHRVIDQARVTQSRGRLLLIQELQKTFALCLRLIGVHAPSRM